MTTKSSQLEALDKQVANSSEKNRNFFTATLLVLVYLIIVVLQTTDLDLLIGHGVHLPLIDVDMPLFAFYLTAPILALALHFNLLQNIEQHHAKLCKWRDVHSNQQVPRENIHPFIFNFSTLDNQSNLSKITQFVSQIVIFWSSPITILLILWRFTDYQNLWITIYHFVLLFTNLWLAMRCIQAANGNSIAPLQSTTPEPLGILCTTIKWAKNVIKWLIKCAPAYLAWCVKEKSNQNINRILGTFILLFGLLPVAWLALFTTNSGYLAQYFSSDEPPIFTSDGSKVPRLGIPRYLIPRISIDNHDNLLALNLDNLKFQFELNEKLETNNSNAEQNNSNPIDPCYPDSVTNRPPIENIYDWFMQYGNGINLRKRSLHFANFESADLRRAWLEDALLQGAFLRGIKLQGAQMDRVQLQEADLISSQLQRASIRSAQMQKAILIDAKLQGANLSLARLENAQLHVANMQETILNGAWLQNAILRYTALQKAKLCGAILIKTDLEKANLQEAVMRDAMLEATNLKGAQLQGAQLQGARLRNITIDEKTNFKGVLIDNNTLVEIYKEGHGTITDETDALLNQMRKQGWPETAATP